MHAHVHGCLAVCLHHPLAAGGWGCPIRQLCQQLYSPLKASGVRSSGKNNLERGGVYIFHEETSVLTSASASQKWNGDIRGAVGSPSSTSPSSKKEMGRMMWAELQGY